MVLSARVAGTLNRPFLGGAERPPRGAATTTARARPQQRPAVQASRACRPTQGAPTPSAAYALGIKGHAPHTITARPSEARNWRRCRIGSCSRNSHQHVSCQHMDSGAKAHDPKKQQARKPYVRNTYIIYVHVRAARRSNTQRRAAQRPAMRRVTTKRLAVLGCTQRDVYHSVIT